MAQRRVTCRDIPIARITSHLLQARKQVDRSEVDRLVASIHHHGLLSPVLVRKKGREYELLAGQRRLAACRRLRWSTIPAIVVEADDIQAIEIALAENIERAPLSPMERVELLEYLTQVLPAETAVEMAHRLGFRADQADQLRQLARLPMLLKEAVNLGVLSADQALLLATLRDEETMEVVLRAIHEKGLDLEQTAALVKSILNRDRKDDRPASLADALSRVEVIYRAAERGKPLDPRVVLPLVEEMIELSQRPLEETLSDDGLAAPMLPLHAFRVARCAILMARAMGMDPTEQKTAAFAGILQDLGMVTVPREVLHYEGPLDDAGRRLVRRHVQETLLILERAGWVPSLARQACATHHERLDGGGYPGGLKGKEVPPLARILAVADTCAAMGEQRPWRARTLPHEGVQALLKEAEEGRLDGEVVKAWVGLVSRFPVLSWLRLGTGELAQVVQANASAPDRPVVRVVLDASGRRLDEPWRMDLATCPEVAFEPCAAPTSI